MKTTMIPGCCGLKTIHQIACLGKTDELSKKMTSEFDEMVKKGTANDGQWYSYGKAPDTVAIITTSPRYNKKEEFERQKAFLEEKGWRLLAVWKSYESGGKNYMYGSPGMEQGD
jgi:uncharacterized phage-like protein YoqJ